MSQTLIIKPAKGVKVRDPKTGEHLPEAGAEVIKNRYWLRRLGDGDVVETTKPDAQGSASAAGGRKPGAAKASTTATSKE